MAKVTVPDHLITAAFESDLAAEGVRIVDRSGAPEQITCEGARASLEIVISRLCGADATKITELVGMIEDGTPADPDAPTTLNQFVSELTVEVGRFKQAYLARHKENPDHYPLEIGANNAGAWFENFMFFYTDGSV